MRVKPLGLWITVYVLGFGKAVVIKQCHYIYELAIGDTQYRSKYKDLKKKKNFKSDILFLSITTCLGSAVFIEWPPYNRVYLSYNTEDTLNLVHKLTRKDILKMFNGFCNKLSLQLNWRNLPWYKKLTRLN